MNYRNLILTLFLVINSGLSARMQQATRVATRYATQAAKERDIVNIIRYNQQPVDLYWGASFGSPFYDSYYNQPPYYGGYNYPYNYGIYFTWYS